MATAEVAPSHPILVREHMLLYGVPWHTYVDLRDLPENYHLRMNYDRGTLEIMSPSNKHEKGTSILARLIEAWTEELNIGLCSLGQTTCRREDIERGFEPDKCYYVQNEPRMWEKDELDFTVDPPPDLAIEVDVSRSSVDKMSIYAAFGVPELWRVDRGRLQAYEFVAGEYRPRESSLCFPQLPLAEVQRVLDQIGKVPETELIRGFRAWVRENFVR
jgi:Uma2 family endonuclease